MLVKFASEISCPLSSQILQEKKIHFLSNNNMIGGYCISSEISDSSLLQVELF